MTSTDQRIAYALGAIAESIRTDIRYAKSTHVDVRELALCAALFVAAPMLVCALLSMLG